MDVVETGRERPPVSRRWLLAGGAALLALAAVGTLRAVDAKPVARRTPSPSPSFVVPPLQTVDPDELSSPPGNGSSIQAFDRYEWEDLRLLLVSEAAVQLAPFGDGGLEPIVSPGDGYVVRSTARVRGGVAALLQPAEFDENGTSHLVVSTGAFQARYPLPGMQRVVQGADDGEFWTVDWLGAHAQRRDADGRPAGKPVRLPAQAELLRGLDGGLMLMTLNRMEPGIAVWDPARRRYHRKIADAAGVVATTSRTVAWATLCEEQPCPIRVTDVRTGAVRTVAVPDDGGYVDGAALDPKGTTLAYRWTSPGGTSDVYAVDAGSDVLQSVATEVRGYVLLDWADHRLVVAEVLDIQTATFVWVPEGGLLGGPVYATSESTALYAAPA